MAYVITQNCCKDGSCVTVCPVSCIRPAGSPGEFTGTEMLYIDPDACIDCVACLEECPVDAIFYDEDLPPDQERFREINARFFERHPLQIHSQETPLERHGVKPGALRVAVVGAGPAACYASTALIGVDGVEAGPARGDVAPRPLGGLAGELAVDEGAHAVLEVPAHGRRSSDADACGSTASRRCASEARSWARPRWMRERTVPILTSRVAAISS